MQIKFFKIAANDPDGDARELNGFLAAHKILTVQRELVHDGHPVPLVCARDKKCSTLPMLVDPEPEERIEGFGIFLDK